MQQAVELVNARPPLVERQLCQLGAIHGFVRIQNLRAEALDDFVINRFARIHEFMANAVGVNDMHPKFGKHTANQRFSSRNTTCESDFQQGPPAFHHRVHRVTEKSTARKFSI